MMLMMTRSLAMKHHPDRYSDPNDKKKATDRFKAISAAYSVLRDRKLTLNKLRRFMADPFFFSFSQKTKGL